MERFNASSGVDENEVRLIMRVKERLKSMVEAVIGYRLIRVFPFGYDFFGEIIDRMPDFDCRCIFDVGTNEGQLVKEYRRRFSDADVYCFEPVKETFRILEEKYGSDAKVYCRNVALGVAKGEARMQVGTESVFNRVIDEQDTRLDQFSDLETVSMVTIEEMRDSIGIDQIDLLKIDTEGCDLDVLKGAIRLVEDQSIRFIYVECGMNPENDLHSPWREVTDFLEGYGYRIFGIYDQQIEWPRKEPHLRRANIAFVSKRTIEGCSREE